MVAVFNQDGDGCSQGPAETHAGQKAGLVGFDGHPPTAPVSALASRQVGVDVRECQGKSCGDTLQ